MAQHPIEINHDKEPIRLFKSNFMEFFTHIHPAVVVLIWAPFGLYMLYRGVVLRPSGVSWAYIPLGFIAGVLVWSFTEYNLHRFVFHFPPRTPRQERITFLFHGVHAQKDLKEFFHVYDWSVYPDEVSDADARDPAVGRATSSINFRMTSGCKRGAPWCTARMASTNASGETSLSR